MHRMLSAGIWIPFVILTIAVGAAFWFQSILTASEPKPDPVEVRDGDRMTLLVGDDYPRLHLLHAAPELAKHAPAPEPRPPADEPKPSPSPTKERYERLGNRDSVYALCKRFGINTPLHEILELNGWSESDARRLRPGTLVRLQ